tara:strand:- start:38111 stop:38695 length:585 start_codon:yes stop_codon:yes gene_type:complete
MMAQNPRVIARAPDSAVADNFVSSPDITYLLEQAPKLTEGITNEDLSKTYTLSPYSDDVIKFLSAKVSRFVGVPRDYLQYINIYHFPVGTIQPKQKYSYDKIQESPVAFTPHGKVIGTATILLSDDATLLLNGSTLDVKKSQIVGVQMVDEQDNLYYNNILESGTVVENDLWLCSFVFTEFPRELNEVYGEIKL